MLWAVVLTDGSPAALALHLIAIHRRSYMLFSQASQMLSAFITFPST